MSTKHEDATKTVDFIPEFGIKGDFKKVTEYGFLQYNTLILPVMALLFMDRGTNFFIPNMGLMDTLLEFPFSTKDEADALVDSINGQLETYCGNTTARLSDASDWDTGEVTLIVQISGIPNPIKVTVDRNSASKHQFKVVSPSTFGVK